MFKEIPQYIVFKYKPPVFGLFDPFFLSGLNRFTCVHCTVCREQRNLSDLCVDPLPCAWSVHDSDDFGSHRSRRLGHRSEHKCGHVMKVMTCAQMLRQITVFSLFLQFRTSQWKKAQVCTRVSNVRNRTEV